MALSSLLICFCNSKGVSCEGDGNYCENKLRSWIIASPPSWANSPHWRFPRHCESVVLWRCELKPRPYHFVLFFAFFLFWDFPDLFFSGCSRTVRGFSRSFVVFLLLGLLINTAPTRNSPERVRDTPSGPFPKKVGNPLVWWKAPLAYLLPSKRAARGDS